MKVGSPAESITVEVYASNDDWDGTHSKTDGFTSTAILFSTRWKEQIPKGPIACCPLLLATTGRALLVTLCSRNLKSASGDREETFT